MSSSRIQRIPADAFNVYQERRLGKLRGFGPLVRLDRWLKQRDQRQVTTYHAAHDWVAFHPWRPGLVDYAERDAEATATRFQRLGWLADSRLDLRGVLMRAMLDFAALQNPWELERFLLRVAELRPRTALEIGTSSGGLLFAIAQLAAPDALIASIDLPERSDGAALAAAMPRVLASLVQPTQTLVIKRESSSLYEVRAEIEAALAGRPLDLLVIDGDHSYGGVRSDLEMYSGLVGPGGLIAIHDVLLRPENAGRGYEVGIYWDELQRTRPGEVLADPNGLPGVFHQQGLPPLERRPAAFGWGIIPG